MATSSRQLVKEGKRNLQTKSLAQQTAKDLWLLQKQEFTAALASHLLFFAFFFFNVRSNTLKSNYQNTLESEKA